MMAWSVPGDEPHVPRVLSAEAINELRLFGLYPNAANLLATLDAAIAERDAQASYALTLREAAERMNRAYREWMADNPAVRSNDVMAAHIHLRDTLTALAKNPNPSGEPGTGAAPSADASGPVGLGPHDPPSPFFEKHAAAVTQANAAMNAHVFGDASLTRNDARYRWLRAEHDRHGGVLMRASVKRHLDRTSGEWANVADSDELDRLIDAELAKGHVCSKCGKPVTPGDGKTVSDWGDNLRCHPSCTEFQMCNNTDSGFDILCDRLECQLARKCTKPEINSK